MTLDEILAALADAGLPLGPGRTAAEVVERMTAPDPAHPQVRDVLLALTDDVWMTPRDAAWTSAPLCERASALDAECIDGPGEYVKLVGRLARTAGTGTLTALGDHVDHQEPDGWWFEYSVGSTTRRLDVDVQGDWADLMAVCSVTDDLRAAHPGAGFWCIRHDQSLALFWLSDDGAAAVDALAGSRVLERL